MEKLTPQQIFNIVDEFTSNEGRRLLTTLTRANQNGTLVDVMESLGALDLLNAKPRNNFFAGKVIVLGASTVKESKMRSFIKKSGLDPEMFEFHLDYKKIKNFNYKKIRESNGYIAIFAGPMPHSTTGKGNSSSFIAKVENNPELYPPMYKLVSGRELKITNNNFKEALCWLKKRLEEIDL